MFSSITAVVPAREGSRRLRNKNVAPFGGQPLLVHKIRQLQRVPEIDRIVVSTDSEVMLELAKAEGVDTHRRSSEYADEIGRSWSETIAHLAEAVPGDLLAWTHCTSPLLDENSYRRAISEFRDAASRGCDSLLTVTPLKEYLWSRDGPLNYEAGKEHVPSQQLPSLYRATGGLFLAPRDAMIRWGYYHGPNPHRMVVSKREAVDIDDGLDLLCARAWMDASPDVSLVNPFDATSSDSM